MDLETQQPAFEGSQWDVRSGVAHDEKLYFCNGRDGRIYSVTAGEIPRAIAEGQGVPIIFL